MTTRPLHENLEKVNWYLQKISIQDQDGKVSHMSRVGGNVDQDGNVQCHMK